MLTTRLHGLLSTLSEYHFFSSSQPSDPVCVMLFYGGFPPKIGERSNLKFCESLISDSFPHPLFFMT